MHDRPVRETGKHLASAPAAGTAEGADRPCATCGIEVDATGVRRTTSRALLGAGTELQILHNDVVYRLTLTRSGKLILHK